MARAACLLQAMNNLQESFPAEPMNLLAEWLAEARARELTPNTHAMTIATVTHQRGQILPSARVVLCKHIDVEDGFLVFYTNYRSRKAQELEQNPVAAAVFHWDALGRQARVEGRVLRSPAAESDAYFGSRPRGSQLGAWSSQQSEPVASRAALLSELDIVTERFADREVPRPPHWGGYRLWATAVELWMQGEHRIHDRARWVRTVGIDDAGNASPDEWTAMRLQP